MTQTTENLGEELKQSPLPANVNEGIKIDAIKPKEQRVLLEILVIGEEKDRKRLDKMMEHIAKQLDFKKNAGRARIRYYIDKGEKTFEEKRDFLLDAMNCKYYIFTGETISVYDNYVEDALNKIRLFEKQYKSMKDFGVYLNPKPVKAESVETTNNDEFHEK